MGPDTGGTLLVISLADFPTVNNDVPTSRCLFPGYEGWNPPQTSPGYVISTYIDGTSIQCYTPPLKISDIAIANGTMIDYPMYTLALVEVVLLERTVNSFWFAYMKDVKIFRLDPPSLYFHEDETERLVEIIGQHYLDTKEELWCKVGFTGLEFEIQA